MESRRGLGVGVGLSFALLAACGQAQPDRPIAAPTQGWAQVGTGGAPGCGGGPPVPPVPRGSTLFATSYGDDGQQTLTAFASDATGNFYVGGDEYPVALALSQMPGTPGPLEGSAQGVFVLKYDPTGQLLWRQAIPVPATGDVQLGGLAVQPTTGDVILAGDFGGTMTIGNSTFTSGNDPASNFSTLNVWVAALDAGGNLLWSRSYPSTKLAVPTRVFATAGGDIELVGFADEGASVGGSPLCCGNGSNGSVLTFAARYSPGGDLIWNTAVGGMNLFDLLQADAAADGSVVLGGEVGTTLSINGQPFPAGRTAPDGTPQIAGVVVRLDPQGQAAWTKIYADPTTAQVGAAFDPATNVVLYGGFSGTIDLGNGVSLTSGQSGNPIYDAALLAKLGPDGTAIWAQQFPSTASDQVFGEGLRADAAGNLVFTGEISGGLSVGGAPPLAAGITGTFVAKYGPDGSFQWSRGFSPPVSFVGTQSLELAFGPSNAVGVAGNFDGSYDFGTGPIAVPGQPAMGTRGVTPVLPDDVFLLKLAP